MRISNKPVIFLYGFLFGIAFNRLYSKFLKSIVEHSNNAILSLLRKKSKQSNQNNVTSHAEHCVGMDSPDAGVADSCAGCPNASTCASTKSEKRIEVEKIENLSKIKNIILVLSGKGGVGKSTISAQVSWYLSSRKFNVGLLDIDICGPSAPKMMGVQNCDVHISANGWSPVFVNEFLSVMSTAFLLPESDDAVIWRGPKKNGLIKQFLTDVDWGELDFLIIDTPPGTSDEHLSIVSYLKDSNVNGALIVTTPQEIALQDVRKEINFCKKVGLNIIGVIENMGKIFKNVEHDSSVKDMCNKMEVNYLTKIPWDEELLFVCDLGISICEKFPNSLTSTGIRNLVDLIVNYSV
ncbi:Cytosolic Fe-S cluster assembly factor NUBP1 [Cryptosporidium felis]|nr:Cytosolic Fe-S cluster assembly factor NUBP1 [Cryptosporidium felis]